MKKVLIVDDHAHTHRLIEVPLKSLGFQVLHADDGEEGVALAQRDRPDVIILDVTMPKLSGMDVLRTLKADEALRPVPVVMLTAQGDDEEVSAAMDAGAAHYLRKPFRPIDVTNLVRQLTGGAE
jgi:DNA-binding response OmpR family regulator